MYAFLLDFAFSCDSYRWYCTFAYVGCTYSSAFNTYSTKFTLPMEFELVDADHMH